MASKGSGKRNLMFNSSIFQNMSVKHLHRNTLDLLYKLTVRSVIDYGIIVYGSTLKASDLARLEQLQYKAGKLVTGALHYPN